ncbi:MAG: ABC transporter permease [Chitinophagaceae bacterium]|nr:ABC transporter permease [Chitinophagaceae bacterium]
MLAKLILRNLLHHWGSTLLSMILLSTGVGIISLLLAVNKQVEDKFNRDLKNIDLVVGAKGSPLQLVLSAVYHLDAPTGNISKEEAEKLLTNPMIEQVTPLAYGDNYDGFRIVGTDSTYLLKYNSSFSRGSMFSNPMEVVAGSNVAKKKELKIGSSFTGTHGLSKDSDDDHEHFKYVVKGILNPTGSVLDNLILTPVESVERVHSERHEHAEHEQHEEGHDEDKTTGKQITALLLTFRSPQAMFSLPRFINESTNMQSASPTLEINRLLGLLGIGMDSVKAVAATLLLVAGLSIFIALYSRLSEKKYELALIRSLGCSRMKLFTLVVSEAILLCLAGFAGGMLLGITGMYWLNEKAADEYSFTLITNNLWNKDQFLLLTGTILIGITAALIPSVKAYRLNISKTLANA